jgi:serine/threonine-protein kinase
VCIIHAVDSSLGAPIIVMEYVTGRPLSQLLERPLPQEQAAALGRQVALGMAAAHARGVVHGDLKPANILVTPAGTAKIVDFGMARRSSTQTEGEATVAWEPSPSGGVSGTPAYMAPEQARGEPATPGSDIFSLGVILYEMVTGRRARQDGNLLELLHRIGHEDLTGNLDETPKPFRELLRLALATAPAERRITMTQIAELLV